MLQKLNKSRCFGFWAYSERFSSFANVGWHNGVPLRKAFVRVALQVVL